MSKFVERRLRIGEPIWLRDGLGVEPMLSVTATDPLGTVRVNGEPVRLDPTAMVEEWTAVPGTRYEIRADSELGKPLVLRARMELQA